MKVPESSISSVVSEMRRRSGMSKSAFADRAGTSRAALDQIEKGERIPRADTWVRILDAAGATISVQAPAPPSVVTRSRGPAETLSTFCASLDVTDASWAWRSLVGDFVANVFVPATLDDRIQLLAERPESTGDERWDAFVGALGEHLALNAEIGLPGWTAPDEAQLLASFWWPVHGNVASLRSRAMALSPASFKRRRILIDGSELPLVLR